MGGGETKVNQTRGRRQPSKPKNNLRKVNLYDKCGEAIQRAVSGIKGKKFDAK